ncbi:MAG: hypothetical protein IH944_05045 [Armatimonadetes bacterium]|nr:hypothetical protein [Armatimonadota bacterium]
METVTLYMPWAALLASALLLVWRGKADEEAKDAGVALPVVITLFVLAAALGVVSRYTTVDWRPVAQWAAVGLALGGLCALLSSWFRADRSGRSAIVAVLALLVISFDAGGFALSTARELASLILGLGVSAYWLAFVDRGGLAQQLTIYLAVAGSSLQLARLGHTEAESYAVLLALSSIAAVIVIRWVLDTVITTENRSLVPVLSTVVLAGALWLIADRIVANSDLGVVLAVAVGAALVCAWTVRQEPDSDQVPSASLGIAMLIWIGVATFAFSMSVGYGLALAGLAGFAGMVVLGRKDLFPTLAPIALLALYRVFREVVPSLGRAFDIGQHYSLVGLVIGVAIVASLGQHWLRKRDSASTLQSFQPLCIVLVASVVVALCVMLFGPKGAIGLMVGLGIAPALTALGQIRAANVMAIALGLSGLVLAGYDPLALQRELERSEKITVLWQGGAVIAVLVALAFWLGTLRKKEKANESQ